MNIGDRVSLPNGAQGTLKRNPYGKAWIVELDGDGGTTGVNERQLTVVLRRREAGAGESTETPAAPQATPAAPTPGPRLVTGPEPVITPEPEAKPAEERTEAWTPGDVNRDLADDEHEAEAVPLFEDMGTGSDTEPVPMTSGDEPEADSETKN